MQGRRTAGGHRRVARVVGRGVQTGAGAVVRAGGAGRATGVRTMSGGAGVRGGGAGIRRTGVSRRVSVAGPPRAAVASGRVTIVVPGGVT